MRTVPPVLAAATAALTLAVAGAAASASTGAGAGAPAVAPPTPEASAEPVAVAARSGEHLTRQPAPASPAPAGTVDAAAAIPALAAAAPTPPPAVSPPAVSPPAVSPSAVPPADGARNAPALLPLPAPNTVTSPGAAPAVPAGDVRSLIVAAFGPAEAGNAVAVALCESGLRADAVGKPNLNGSRDWGLFQLNDHGSLQGALAAIGQPASSDIAAQTAALNPATNVAAAKAMFDRRGWQPWTCAAKLGIVDGLWSSARGPNYGAYTVDGRLAATTRPAP